MSTHGGQLEERAPIVQNALLSQLEDAAKDFRREFVDIVNLVVMNLGTGGARRHEACPAAKGCGGKEEPE
jgi:hypothetical protein